MKKRFAALFGAMTAALLLVTPVFGAETVNTLESAPISMAKETPYWSQCQLGTTVTDAMRSASGSELALLPTGLLANDLHSGDVTEEDIQSVFTADEALGTAEVTPAELFALLEESVSCVTVSTETEHILEEESVYDGFCQISGFTMKYDASAPVGERVLEVVLDDGTALSADDTAQTCTLCAPVSLLNGEYGGEPVSYTETGETLVSALTEYAAENSSLPVDSADRITVIGARVSLITKTFTRRNCFLLAVVLILFCVVSGGRYQKYRDEYGSRYGGKKGADSEFFN